MHCARRDDSTVAVKTFRRCVSLMTQSLRIRESEKEKNREKEREREKDVKLSSFFYLHISVRLLFAQSAEVHVLQSTSLI